MDHLPTDVRRLASRMALLREKAKALGVFTNDRDLFVCSKCGLLEDVTFDGLLITCHPTALGKDTSLRFKAVSSARFRCPECNKTIKVKWL
ncbi:MAG TPA: hypothetical protein VE988_20235 [Gemmataceae bacterium]|nr:hypothetical protein [Gemmataceae bacterium]